MQRAAADSLLHRTLTQAWRQRGVLAWLMWPLSLLWGALAALRRGLYRWGWLSTSGVPVPVVVVGNVLVGGSGKTPVVIALVKHLQAQGWHVGVISRGYGRHTRDCREVLAHSAAHEVGDEPALILHATSAPVFVATHRVQAARALLATYPQVQIIISDDGLQHLALKRDIDLCVFDDRGLGNGFLLPAGPLREPWPRPVDLVVHTGNQPALAAIPGFKAQRRLADHALRADGRPVPFSELRRPGDPPLLALAGIAKPEDFFIMLRQQGLVLAQTLALPDHFDFDNFDLSPYKDFTLVCTEKDAVKLWRYEPQALAVALTLTLAPDLLARLDQLLRAHQSPTLSSAHGHTTS